MSTQTDRQKIGSAGHSIAQTEISLSKYWIARNLTEDYGIDLELEYTPLKTINNDAVVSGKFIKAQIRSHQKNIVRNAQKDFLIDYMDYGFLRYAYECRIPIILIVVEIESRKSWYVWLQGYIIENRLAKVIYEKDPLKEIGIRIPYSSSLKGGLESALISIASWEHRHQLYLAIKELATLSSKLFEDELAQILEKYLVLLATDVDSVVTAVVDMGPAIWATVEGNKLTRILYNYIKRNGKLFRASDIERLVCRDDTYSRVGINALGVLYENFPEHLMSLKLCEMFNKYKDPRVYYFCALREKYINKKSPSWFSDKNVNFTIDKLTIPEQYQSDLLNKWANRGDSAILDYVVELE